MKAKKANPLHVTLEMIKIEHTVFALPFAFLGAILAYRGLPPLPVWGWILLAMVGARSAAMAFNRLVDASIDTQNPRTRERALPRGLVTQGYVIGFTVISVGVFLLAAFMLNRLSFILAFPALVVILGYSFTKRFTSLSHLLLGLSLSIAPAGGWIAVTGTFSPLIFILSAVVVTWVAGFDVIYACQDYKFDSHFGLYSIPVKFGIEKALRISFYLHLATVAGLAVMVWAFQLSWFSGVGIVFLAAILAYEHHLIPPDNLARVNLAFFTINGIFSIMLFLLVLCDLLIITPAWSHT